MVCRMDWIRAAEMVIRRQQIWAGEISLLVKRLLYKHEVLLPPPPVCIKRPGVVVGVSSP